MISGKKVLTTDTRQGGQDINCKAGAEMHEQRQYRYYYRVSSRNLVTAPQRRSVAAALLFAGALAGTPACGRLPTDPSRSDLSGNWNSFDRDLYITNIQLRMIQPVPGRVEGRWTAQGRVDGNCPPVVPCGDSGILRGRNEVSQVVLEILGAGDFVGELVKQDTLKGIIRSSGLNFHVTFGRQK